MAFLSSFVAKLFSVPVIHEVNGPYDDLFITHPKFKLFKVPLVFLQRSQYKLASHLLPVTEKLSEWLRDQTQHNRITVISNGANTDLFNPDAGKPENPIQGKYVLFFGSMAKWHDLETVIASTCDPNWPKDVKLALLGNGMDQLQDERVTNNLNIIVVGYQDYHKMPRYISQALAGLVIIADFAGRSQKGLAPLKLYETLACGVPAIVTDYPGQAEFVRDNECGLVVAPESSAELAAAVKFLAEHEAEAKRYGENGRKVLEEKHSWWKLSGDVYNIIVNCVKDK
jgi:glycosyltransferase involved in cell wall biosynthesis